MRLCTVMLKVDCVQRRAGAMFLTALVLTSQGKATQGKLLLTKALKRAHQHLKNHQLVSQARRLCQARMVQGVGV